MPKQLSTGPELPYFISAGAMASSPDGKGVILFGGKRQLPDLALFTSAELVYMLFEFATKNSPISSCCGSCQLLTTLLFKMFKGILGFSINISCHRCKN